MAPVLFLVILQLTLRDDFDHRLGVVWADEDTGCLAIDNAAIKPTPSSSRSR
jgi:hypothetical protein